MSKSNFYENALLKLIFNAIPIAGIARDDAIPNTHLYVALHTADPGEAGVQTSNETAYTGYARLPVVRTALGWVVTGNVVNPAVNLDFLVCTAAPGAQLTHFSVGLAAAGATEILYKGSLTPAIPIAVGLIPRLTVGTIINEE